MQMRFQSIQALRGVACLLVVWFHLAPFPDRFGNRALAIDVAHWFGFAGVDLFFVLSGFIITHVSASRMGMPSAVPGFLFRRGWRIYPVYWVAAGVALATAAGIASVDWPAIAAHGVSWLALIPYQESNAILGPAWTLVYEIQFYVVFGLLMLLPRTWAWKCLAMWSLAVAAGFALPLGSKSVWVRHLLSPYILEFVSGVAVARLIAHGRVGGWRMAGLAGLAMGICATVANWHLIQSGRMNAHIDSRVRVLLFGPSCALLVYAAAAAEVIRARSMPRWLLGIGNASYSLYLTHPNSHMAMIAVWMALPAPRPGPNAWLPAMFFASVGFGYLFYLLVEKPTQSLARRPQRNKDAEPAWEVSPPVLRAA
jgi:exopolysaccharide production protein ExoZ